jgi:hypothetical protein
VPLHYAILVDPVCLPLFSSIHIRTGRNRAWGPVVCMFHSSIQIDRISFISQVRPEAVVSDWPYLLQILILHSWFLAVTALWLWVNLGSLLHHNEQNLALWVLKNYSCWQRIKQNLCWWPCYLHLLHLISVNL